MGEWTTRWGYEVAEKATRPGMWRLKEGGYLVRARVTDPRTSKRHQVMRVLPGVSLKEADRIFAAEKDAARARVRGVTPTQMRWSEFAASQLEDRILSGEIQSKATRERWQTTLEHYLIPEFGAYWVTELRRSDIETARKKWARWIHSGKPNLRKRNENSPALVPCQPSTVNGWLRILASICKVASATFEVINPFVGIKFFPEGRAYTAENPNAIQPQQVATFMRLAKQKYPQHYAMIMLGIVTGLRPSSMRPLRRRGPEADIDWATGRLLVRRSHSRAGEIMNKTKTGIDGTIYLPEGMIRILKEHVDELEGDALKSDYLFPAEDGSIRSHTGLRRPFESLRKSLGLSALTPRAMRRTFNDIARAANVSNVVTRSISGHQTEEMQMHYSTAQAAEQKEAVGRVLALAEPKIRGVKGGVKK